MFLEFLRCIRLMEIQHTVKLPEKHRVCINIKREYGVLLDFLSQGDINRFLEYLLKKHKKEIFRIMRIINKKTATVTYQPSTRNYARKVIPVSPYLWKTFKEMRELTGFSISALIRIFLEWELEEETGYDGIWIRKDRLEDRTEDWNDSTFNNYTKVVVGDRERNVIFCYYWDDS